MPAGVTNSSFFPDVTVVAAILLVMSSIDFTDMKIIFIQTLAAKSDKLLLLYIIDKYSFIIITFDTLLLK